ncbi:unnamed protein product [Kuraishia capsulata CBS 1993]|uniref:RAVE subunit 2/Rogdi n=1 Tax=Kuraishia capsulata CBS 1993 TaxID=1382522 RepID=W6MRY7_9ASCO|nr:uncharacterized protein KUCA_T00000556001 [Kuraishia capsulata CBS 1993]CDK24590.1 unnamed protein product [Kuraishia capsulata CBS 1993]
MSTSIYSATPLSDADIAVKAKKSVENELVWLISEVIVPGLPSLRDTLDFCLQQIDDTNETEFKLPLSSHNSEILKGVITRTNYKITALNVSIRNIKTLNSGRPYNIQLNPGETLILKQVLSCHDFIYNAISIIDKVYGSHQDSSIPQLTPLETFNQMQKLVKAIQTAKDALKTPPRSILFPETRLGSRKFTPPLPSLVSLDIFVSNADVSIDFRKLSPVTAKPWGIIVHPAQKLSFADVVRTRISQDRTMSVPNIIKAEYNKLVTWIDERKQSKEKQESSPLSAVISLFSGNNEPTMNNLLKTSSKYLEECVTFVDSSNSPIVVTLDQSAEIMSPDPVLLSISVKLESLEKCCTRFCENLETLLGLVH